MKLPDTQLRKAIKVENRRQYLINQLLDHDIEKSSDGRELQKLSLYELENIFIEVKCKCAREMNMV